MNRTAKIFAITLSLICVAIVGAGFAYRRHLQFLMEDYSGVRSTVSIVAFPAPGTPVLENAFVIDGMRMPFTESEIKSIRKYEHIPCVAIGLDGGVGILVHAPAQVGSERDKLLETTRFGSASRDDFRWSMSVGEIELLHKKIKENETLLDVKQISLNSDSRWYGSIYQYPKINELEWTTTDEKWKGCVYFIFHKSQALEGDSTKQLELMSQFDVIALPMGTFDQEIEALIERIRAKNPDAVKSINDPE